MVAKLWIFVQVKSGKHARNSTPPRCLVASVVAYTFRGLWTRTQSTPPKSLVVPVVAYTFRFFAFEGKEGIFHFKNLDGARGINC